MTSTFVNSWAVDAIDTLNACPVGNLTDGESRVEATPRLGQNNALEHLDTLFATFDHAIVDLDGITDIEVGNV
jgi:hypothetical protein